MEVAAFEDICCPPLLIGGWSNNVIMGMVEEEEIKIVYDSPKHVRGEKLYWKCGSKVSRNVLSS